MAEVTAQYWVRNAKNAQRTITLKPCVKVVMTNMTQAAPDPKKARVIKGKKCHEVTEDQNNAMDD